MAGLKRSLLLVLLLSWAARAQESWLCKKDLAYKPDSAPPTSVALDKQGRIYLLYNADGILDIYDDQGNLVQHRGGKAEEAHAPQSVTPQSLWVGRLATSALLASDDVHQSTNIVLIPEGEKGDKFKTVVLHKLRAPIAGTCALAKDLDGRLFLWNGNTIRIFDPTGENKGTVQLPPLKRPVQLAVDSRGGFYCLDTAGLHVFTSKGEFRYEVLGAQVMYLTGADRLAALGPDWLRRYSPKGVIEVDVREPVWLRDKTPTAISINDKGQFFAYLRGEQGDGVILRLDSRGDIAQEFPQPVRLPSVPDAGFRLDYEGRLHYWDSQTRQLLKVHPSGKVESSLAYTPGADPQGRMQNPTDMVIDGEGTLWISDSGNSRLQRFSLAKGGWQDPVPVAIKDGAGRATPRSLALTPGGTLLVVVHPPSPGQDVVLQTRNLKGELLNQRNLGDNRGDPVVKVACSPNGDIWIYRSLSGLQGLENNPTLERFDVRGNKVASLGPDGRLLTPPGQASSRLVLKPQENLVPFQNGLLVATQGRFLKISPDLRVTELAKLAHPRKTPGRKIDPDFGEATLVNNVLWVTDLENHCLHRIPVPSPGGGPTPAPH